MHENGVRHARHLAFAWRTSIVGWLRCQHPITASRKTKPSPSFDSFMTGVRKVLFHLAAILSVSLFTPFALFGDVPTHKGQEAIYPPNGGDISDGFIVSLIDKMIDCVNSAKESDTRLVIKQRARMLDALWLALESMFESESAGKTSFALGEFLANHEETRRSLGQIIKLYKLYADVSEKENMDGVPARVLRKAIPFLNSLRESVALYRSRVKDLHNTERPPTNRSKAEHP